MGLVFWKNIKDRNVEMLWNSGFWGYHTIIAKTKVVCEATGKNIGLAPFWRVLQIGGIVESWNVIVLKILMEERYDDCSSNFFEMILRMWLLNF